MADIRAVTNPAGGLQFGNFAFNSTYKFFSNLAKRLFDIILSFIGLIFLTPAFLFISILIKRDSPGPIFYWCPRVGKGGRAFKMLKFRTMFECPDSYRGPRITVKGDQRITPLGRWLRDTKINELPQLWNVLIGQMSLVGPRPEDTTIIKDWPEDARREILKVRPGVTSPASILYHNEEELLSQKDVVGDYFKSILPDKMRLDRLYVRNHSFFADLDVVLWTLVILIPRLGEYKIPEISFFAGPISSLFHRYVSWFVIDLCVSLCAAGAGGLAWRSQEPLNWGFDHLVVLSVILALLFSSVNSILGFNKILWSRANFEDGFGLTVSSVSVSLLLLLLNFCQNHYHLLDHPALPQGMIFTIGLMAGIGFIAVRYRLRLITSFASRWLTLRKNSLAVGERVLIVGAGEGSKIGSWLLSCSAFRNGFSVVGIVEDEDPSKHGMRVDGCWVIGGIKDIPNLIKKHDIGIIMVTIPGLAQEMKDYVQSLARDTNIRLVYLYDLLEVIYQKLASPAVAD